MGKNRLHALLAVVSGQKGAADKISKETQATFGNKSHLFDGSLRTYQPLDANGETLPEDRNPISTTVGAKLKHFQRYFAPFMDATFQVDETNMEARATVEVDGLKIENVPATYLMRLDGQLAEIRKVFDKIPTLDPKHEWESDPDKGQGVMKAKHDIKTNRSVDKITPVVLYEHQFGPDGQAIPAQIKERSESVKVGEYTQKLWSGRVSPAVKHEVIARLDKLQKAVRKALSKANDVEHSSKKVSKDIFDFLLNGVE